MKRAEGRPVVVALLASLASAGCTRAPGAADAATPTPLRVFAAASLTASFQAIAAAFEQQHPGHRVELHFAGTPQLVLQLREGASADVFASADVPNMTKVQDLGAVVDPPVEFARNQLVIAVRAGNPKGVRGLADLARADVQVALCGPEVPAGKYARQMLQGAGIEVRSVSDEPSVKAVVTKVQLGELDAALVYATDVGVSGVEGVALPATANVVASYPIGVLDRGDNRVGAARFVAFVCSDAGRSILRQHGFLLP